MLEHSRHRVFAALSILAVLGARVLTYVPQLSDPAASANKSLVIAAPPSHANQTPTLPSAPAGAAATQKPPAQIQTSAPLPTDAASALRGTRQEEVAPVAVPELSAFPTLIHTVKPGESVGAIAYRYLPQTTFMMTGELEAAIRQANPALAGKHLQPGQPIVIPGIETAPTLELRPAPMPKNAEVHAIYLTGWTAGSSHGLEIIRRWRTLGGNAVVFDLKDFDGLVSVAFSHPLAPEKQRPPIRSLAKLVRFLRQLGLQSIGRIALFRDEQMATHHPELAVQSRRAKGPWRENGKPVWTDPSRREVQNYNIALAKHAAEAGIDEVQFDYVRFPAEGDQADAQFSFQSEHPEWPRTKVISDFLERAYNQLHPLGVLVSLDVFGVMAWQRPIDLAHTGQDIPTMARFCDVLSPMIYPSHFFGMDGFAKPGDAPEHFISESMDRFRKVTATTEVVLRPWLQAFAWRTKTYSPGYIRTQTKIAEEKGGIGFLFWNARNDYATPFLAMIEMRSAASKASHRDQTQPRPDEKSPAAVPPSRPPTGQMVFPLPTAPMVHSKAETAAPSQ